MPKKLQPDRTQFSIWLLSEDLERAEKLVEKMKHDRMLASSATVSRSTVLRLAVGYGLDFLEKKYG